MESQNKKDLLGSLWEEKSGCGFLPIAGTEGVGPGLETPLVFDCISIVSKTSRYNYNKIKQIVTDKVGSGSRPPAVY